MVRLRNANVAGEKGFTLIELIVVIAIIAILALILVPRFSGYTDKARDNAAKSDARNIIMAVQVVLTEGKTSITRTDIEGTLGTAISGKICDNTVSISTGNIVTAVPTETSGLTEATFTYFYPLNANEYYAVKVEKGTIVN